MSHPYAPPPPHSHTGPSQADVGRRSEHPTGPIPAVVEAPRLHAVTGPTLPPSPYEAELPLTLAHQAPPAAPVATAPQVAGAQHGTDPGDDTVGEGGRFAYAGTESVDRPAQRPADWGVRGALRRMTGGLIKPAPGPAERLHRQAEAMTRATFPAARTIVVSQPKGGAGKTPTTLILSGLLAELRREQVAAWDNNELRGTLGLRAEIGTPATTVSDVLTDYDRLADPHAGPGALAGMLRRQPEGSVVLASSENATAMQQIDHLQCKRIHRLLLTRYGLLVVDTGNNTAAPNYGYAIQMADVLVIPTEPKPEHIHVVSQLLALLASHASTEHLVRTAVVVCSSGTGQSLSVENETWLRERVGQVLTVPTDPAIAAGGRLRLSELSEPSRRAWTQVCAAVAEAAVRPSPHDQPARRQTHTNPTA